MATLFCSQIGYMPNKVIGLRAKFVGVRKTMWSTTSDTVEEYSGHVDALLGGDACLAVTIGKSHS